MCEKCNITKALFRSRIMIYHNKLSNIVSRQNPPINGQKNVLFRINMIPRLYWVNTINHPAAN